MTEEQKQEFEALTRPVIEWLNANCHPHVAVVIEPTSAVLYEGEVVKQAIEDGRCNFSFLDSDDADDPQSEFHDCGEDTCVCGA